MAELISLEALEVALDEGGVPHLARLGADPSPAAQAVRRALQIDLALLQRNPEALLTSLLLRAGFEPGLEAWRARWIEEHARLHPGRPWLRPLGPPQHRLAGALRGELRLFEDPGVKAIDNDATVQLLSEAGAAQWHPETGVVTEVQAPPAAEPALEVVGGNWVPVALRDTQTGREQVILDGEFVLSSSAISSDARWIALRVSDLDGYSSLIVVDPQGRRLLETHARAGALAFSANGDWLIHGSQPVTVSRPDGSDRLELATDAGGAVVSDDGRWAATSWHGVVRRWALDRSAAPDERLIPGMPLTFSLDGNRLAFGQSLYDARTGVRVAEIDYRLQPYLEGGPPAHNFHLGSERLLIAEGAMRAWDSHSGLAVFQDRSKTPLFHSALVGYSPEGRHFVTGRRGSPRFTVQSVDGQPPIAINSPLEVTSVVALGARGETIAFGDQRGKVEVRLVKSGGLVGTFGVHRTEVARMEFLDEAMIFSADRKGRAVLWRCADGIVEAVRDDWRWSHPSDAARWRAGQEDEWALTVEGGCTRFVRGDVSLLAPGSEPFVAHPSEPIFASASMHLRIEEG